MPRHREFPRTREEISVKQDLDAILNRTQTVFRRARWERTKPGAVLVVVDGINGKTYQARSKEKRRKRLAYVQVTEVRRELVKDARMEDIIAEGYPHYTKERYITAYCLRYVQTPDDMCTVIKFKYITQAAWRKAWQVEANTRMIQGLVIYEAAVYCADGTEVRHCLKSLREGREWLKTEALKLHHAGREPQRGTLDRCEIIAANNTNAEFCLGLLNREGWAKYRVNVANYNLVVREDAKPLGRPKGKQAAVIDAA